LAALRCKDAFHADAGPHANGEIPKLDTFGSLVAPIDVDEQTRESLAVDGAGFDIVRGVSRALR
jgi:hypothetical protein